MGKKSEEKKKVWKTMLLLGAAIMACLGFTGGNRRYLEENPLNQYVSLAYPSACTTDESGGAYVIDQSKQRVVAFTKDGKYLYEINGGSRSETAFYSAELI